MSRSYTSSSSQYHDAPAPLTAVPITMACWFNPLAVAGTTRVLMSLNTSGSADNAHILRMSTADQLVALSRTSVQDAGTTVVTQIPNAWNHAVGVWASATKRTPYLNGTSGAPGTVSRIPAGIDGFYLGRGTTTTQYMDGYIAEPAIWNVALSLNEITMLYKGFSPLMVRPDALVYYAPLIGRASPEICLLNPTYNMIQHGGPPLAAHIPTIERA